MHNVIIHAIPFLDVIDAPFVPNGRQIFAFILSKHNHKFILEMLENLCVLFQVKTF